MLMIVKYIIPNRIESRPNCCGTHIRFSMKLQLQMEVKRNG